MALIDIWSIINPIKNDLQQKAWQIVNDVTARISNIIGGVIEGVKLYIGFIVNGVKNSLEYAINNVKSAVDSAKWQIENKINEVKSKIEGIVSQITYKVLEIKDNFNSLLHSTKTAIELRINDVRFTIENTINRVIGNAERLINSAIDKVESKINLLITTVSNISDSILNTITSKISSLTVDISNKITSIYDGIKSAVSGFISSAKIAIENKIDHVVSRLNAIWDNIKITVNDVKNSIVNTFNIIKDGLAARIREVQDNIGRTIEIYMDRLKNKYTEIKEDLTNFIDSQIKSVKDRIDKMVADIRKGFEDLLSSIDTRIDDWRDTIGIELDARFNDFSRVFNKLTTNQYDSFDEFIADFNEIGGSGGILSTMIGILTISSSYINTMVGIGQPFKENIQNLAMEKARPTILAPSQVARAFQRGYIHDDFMRSELGLSGLTDKRQDTLLSLESEITSPGEAQIAFLRGLINEREHDEILSKWGFVDDKIELLKELYLVIPPISDIITMSVREVFSKETTERFGQFEDYPPLFGEFAKQQGLSEQWAKNYWAAHWSLPSPMQGFEMLHRRIIDRNDLVMLLKALDIMPFWREKLIQLSYNPLTRVDVRRMHKVGVLTEQQVYESYLDIGYNDVNAKRLTEFTVKLNTPSPLNSNQEIRTLTRNIIEQAYRQGIIGVDEFISRIVKIGYDSSDAEFLLRLQDSLKQIDSTPDVRTRVVERTIKMILSAYATRTFGKQEALDQLIQMGLTQLEASTELGLVDYEINTKLKQKYVESIQELYTNWVIEQSDVFIYLNDLGFSQGEISLLIEELDIVRNTRNRLPTMTDLKRWVTSGIISLEEYVNDLKGQGYPDLYIERYVKEFNGV